MDLLNFSNSASAEEPKFPFSSDMQEKVVVRLFRDKGFLMKLFPLVKPTFFISVYHQICVSCVLQHYLQYKDLLPLDYLVEKVTGYLAKDTRLSSDSFMTLFQTLFTATIPEKDQYLEDESLAFLKTQNFLRSLVEAKSKVLNERDFSGAAKLIHKAAGDVSGSYIMYDHERTIVERTEVLLKPRKCVPLIVVPKLDECLQGGVGAGELMTIIGPAGKGKTLVLVNFAKGALLKGVNVLYVTLETSAHTICQRVDSSLTSMTKFQMKADPDKLMQSVRGHYTRFGGKLLVAQYPAGRATTTSIEHLICELDSKDNIKVDVLIVDYPDLLSSGRKRDERRFELTEIYTDLRSLGSANLFDIPVIGASQSNRCSYSSDIETIDLDNVAEDLGKVQISDIAITLNQTQQEVEKDPKEMRLFLAKNRDFISRISIPILVNPATMQIYPPPAVTSLPTNTSTNAKTQTSGGAVNNRGQWKSRNQVSVDASILANKRHIPT